MRTVVLVDDHTLIAEALHGMINTFHGYRVLYEVENGKVLMKRLLQKSEAVPEIILLDINMPVMNGFETAQWLSSNFPEIKIMALSMQNDEETLRKIIACGAKGFILKNITPTELQNALDALVEKGYYYPDWVTFKIMATLSGSSAPSQEPVLNSREREFLTYIATELTYKDIADKMFCSPRTVEGYRDSLFEKFGVKTRVGLVTYALKHDLIKI
jgi:DNA-binding NarL/FixJ family response regulator